MKKKSKARKHSAGSKPTRSSKANTATVAGDWTWIRIDWPFVLPGYVREALQKLNKKGDIAYVVGGSVRDFLLKREPKDHDIATNISPDRLCKIFPSAIKVGKDFGVIKIPIKSETILELATFREDGEYKDHRHPTKVRFAGPQEDATRRDFTINGLFYDHKTNRVLDLVGGIDDLKKEVIRAIGNPSHRFEEDALRLLRGIRFSATLGFKIESKTLRGIESKAHLIKRVSLERVRDELTLMFQGPRPALALRLLSKTSLLRYVLPELESLKGVKQSPIYDQTLDIWNHKIALLRLFRKLYPEPSSILAWSVLLYDVGKPEAAKKSDGENFNNYEVIGAKQARKICARMKLSKIETDTIEALILEHRKFYDVFEMREATLRRWIKKPYFEELLALHHIDAMSSDGNLAYYEFCRSRMLEEHENQNQAVLLTGKDLLQLGFNPGPKFSTILKVVEDLTLEKKLKSKEEALEFVVKNFVS